MLWHPPYPSRASDFNVCVCLRGVELKVKNRAACTFFRVRCGADQHIKQGNRHLNIRTDYAVAPYRHIQPVTRYETHTPRNEDINTTAIVEILLTKPDLENMRQMCC